MEPVEKLKNIGPKMKKYLREIGIITKNDLIQRGAYATYQELKEKNIITHRMAYYALEGALANKHILEIFLLVKQRER